MTSGGLYILDDLLQTADSTQSGKKVKTYLGRPTTLGSQSTSTKKMRAARKRARQNRKRARR